MANKNNIVTVVIYSTATMLATYTGAAQTHHRESRDTCECMYEH